MSISRSGARRDLARQLDELVGGVAARADHGAHAVALLECGDDAARHVADAGGVGDRRATVFLDHDRHGVTSGKDGATV